MLELNHSEGIHDLGYIKWDMAGCLFLVYLICYFSLWKGISTSGKVGNFAYFYIVYIGRYCLIIHKILFLP